MRDHLEKRLREIGDPAAIDCRSRGAGCVVLVTTWGADGVRQQREFLGGSCAVAFSEAHAFFERIIINRVAEDASAEAVTPEPTDEDAGLAKNNRMSVSDEMMTVDPRCGHEVVLGYRCRRRGCNRL